MFAKSRNIAILALALALTFALSGCAGTPSVYAEVDGQEITREEFNRYLGFIQFLNPGQEVSREDQQQILDDMVAEKVYLAEALARGIEVDESEVQEDYENFRQEIIQSDRFSGNVTAYHSRMQELDLTEDWVVALLGDYKRINNMVDAELDNIEEPDAEEIEEFYEEEKEDLFAHGERRNVRHILINEDNFSDADEADSARIEELAQEIYQRLVDGEDFAQLALEFSQDTSAEDGGEIGFVEKKDVVKEFGDVAFDIEPGVVAEPVESQYGWHVLEVLEVEESGYFELDDELREYISASLLAQRQRAAEDLLLSSLLEEADITINFN